MELDWCFRWGIDMLIVLVILRKHHCYIFEKNDLGTQKTLTAYYPSDNLHIPNTIEIISEH